MSNNIDILRCDVMTWHFFSHYLHFVKWIYRSANGFSSERVRIAELWWFLSTWTSFWTSSHCQVNGCLRHRNVHVTSVWYKKVKADPWIIVSVNPKWMSGCTFVSHIEAKWWRHQMETFSALLAICAGYSPVPGEFPAQRPVTRTFDVFFDLRLNKWLSKQSWGWWCETLSRPLWRHHNANDLNTGDHHCKSIEMGNTTLYW